ncbi:MAG: hypothetical protein ACFFFB_12220 [Candidatus Heimdallarchaeota archaeon]
MISFLAPTQASSKIGTKILICSSIILPIPAISVTVSPLNSDVERTQRITSS